MMTREETKCFLCGTSLNITKEPNSPSLGMVDGGLFFRASGNYGSAIFDPITAEEYLEIVICDKCVVEQKNKINYIHDIVRNSTATVEVFEPVNGFETPE